MSLVKGKGAGCYASNATIAQEVGCDYTSVSRSITRLLDWGYIVRERNPDDRRMTVYRVKFPPRDSWPKCQASTPKVVGEAANPEADIVGNGRSEFGAELRKPDDHYIPLNGELNSANQELNSLERARFAARGLAGIEREPTPGARLANA